MSKVIITADIHLGTPGKHSAVLWALETMSQYAIQNDIQEILVLGDLTHDRESLGLDCLNDSYAFFRKEKDAGRQWICFPGNHDMFLRHSWDINSLKPLENVITYIDGVKLLTIDDARFWILPFIQLETAYMAVLAAISAQALPTDYLLTHIGVCEAIKNVCFLLAEWNLVNFKDTPFKKVFTGHFHCHQQVGDKTWYPGSPIPLKSDEGDCNHGFIVLDLITGEHEFIDIWETAEKLAVPTPVDGVPPLYWTVHHNDLTTVDTKLVKGNIIKIAHDRHYDEAEKDKVTADLIARGAKSVKWLDISEDEEQVVAANPNDFNNLFQQYLEQDKKDTAKLSTPLLLKLHQEVIVEADDRYYLNTIDEIE